MPYDVGIAEVLRGDLAEQVNLSEKKMFGGLCFVLNGNMLCGVHQGGGMFRVGKNNETEARSIEGTSEMDFTGRPMAGFVNVDDNLMSDDVRRLAVLALALDFVGALPPKG